MPYIILIIEQFKFCKYNYRPTLIFSPLPFDRIALGTMKYTALVAVLIASVILGSLEARIPASKSQSFTMPYAVHIFYCLRLQKLKMKSLFFKHKLLDPEPDTGFIWVL